MIELEGVPELVDPVMVAAFEGWNDAGDAASTAVGHMEREWKGEVFAALDAEDYYDFQVNRPQVWLDGGSRKITWPTTRLAVVRVDDAGGKGRPRDLVLVRGIEPSMRWRSFCNEILGFAHELGVEMVVVLGALLGDTPHSRPVPVTGVTSDPDLARTMNLEESRYEGPTGIVGILQEACTHAGVPAVSLWASVPHYVSQPPNPKATLALLNRLEDLLQLNVPLGELQEDARAWQLGVDQLAAEDSEVAEYVQSLEEARDTAELPEASGEAIAKEFERYLRRRDDGPGTAPGPGGPGGPGGRSRPPRQPARESTQHDKKDKGEGKGEDKDEGPGGGTTNGEQAEPGGEAEPAGGTDETGTSEPGRDEAGAKPAKKPAKRPAKRAAKPAKRTSTTRGSSKSTSKGTKGTQSAKTTRSSRGSKPAKADGEGKDDAADSSDGSKSGGEKPETSSGEGQGQGPTGGNGETGEPGETGETGETGKKSRNSRNSSSNGGTSANSRNSKSGGAGKGRKKKADDEAPGEE